MGLNLAFDVMVGVSTAQNTANAVPALQLQVPKVILVETNHAAKGKWSFGITKVLTNRGVLVLDPLNLSQKESSRIDLIKERLLQLIEKYDAVLFNLGGGQKAQQIAMWDVFVARNNPSDRAAYANLENGKLEVWSRDNEELSYHNFDLNSPLRVAEILTIFSKSIYSLDDKPADFQGELYQLYQEGPLKLIIHGNRKKSKIENVEDSPLTKKELTFSFLWRNHVEIESLLNKYLVAPNGRIKDVEFG